MPKDEVRNVYAEIPDRRVIRTEDVYQMSTEVGTEGYSDELLAVVANYNNSGAPLGYNAVGMAGRSKRGEVACQLFGVLNDKGVIESIGFKSRGCIAMTACASQICTLVYGKTYEEALAVTDQQLRDSLGGTPPDKRDTSVFAVEAVRGMIGDYLLKSGASLEELDRVVPCDQSGINCLLCEHCSLRDARIDKQFG